ncbi:MAG: DUF2752 domain-containing protein [Planctomycetes bacterium]|nr:DUF2752 domain-containing protein [Planctomycetota bacterium]
MSHDATHATGPDGADGAPGQRPWRPALVPSDRRAGRYDRLELLLFAAVLALAALTPPRDALGRPNAPLRTTLEESTGGGLCVWKRVTDRPCAGCGLTRGFVQLAHGEVVAALRLNPLTPAVFAWVVWRALELLAFVALGRRLVHGIPPRWVWRLYGACGIGFVTLAAARWILGVEGL